jgi:S1-C subfamily serine protease
MLLAVGCAPLASAPPPDPKPLAAPEIEQLDSAVERAARLKIPALARDSNLRHAKRLTVRVRNTGCEGVATGSGFAIDKEILVTNRHVLAGADHVELATWDGHSQHVEFAFVASAGDIALIRSESPLPQVATLGADVRSGDEVSVVGYPHGGPLTISEGVIVDETDGSRFEIPGPVLRMTATVAPGNSGGPVLDKKGHVVAVVFAIERDTGLSLAIPNGTIQHMFDIGGLEDLPPCGQE